MRLNLALSQEQLAKELGVDITTISGWETGKKKPNLENVRKIAQFFNLSIPEVWKIIEETKNENKS
jgi:DNA-binding XRE family transcriptional regulator